MSHGKPAQTTNFKNTGVCLSIRPQRLSAQTRGNVPHANPNRTNRHRRCNWGSLDRISHLQKQGKLVRKKEWAL